MLGDLIINVYMYRVVVKTTCKVCVLRVACDWKA